MRILIVTNHYPVESRPNYGIYVAEQVRSLREMGLDIDVLFFNPKETRLNYFLSLPHVVKALHSTHYDIVHTHHTYAMVVVETARMVAHRRVPVVLTSHEGEATDGKRTTRTWHPTSRLRHWIGLKRLVAGRADFVIFVSRELAAAVSPAKPYAVIPCGIDLNKFQPIDRGWCRSRLGLPADSPLVFFPAAPRAEGKRFALARSAHAIIQQRLPNASLVTAGGIPHEVMPLYYNAADVILQASFYEASPTVVKECLACEIPLVSTDVGDTREVIAGVPHCHVCSDDPSELAERVLASMGKRAVGGRERILELGMALEQVAQQVSRVYDKVARLQL